MGGSIIPAEILFTLLPKLANNFHIHRDYGLPSWTSKNDLVICISWSGGTKETISSYQAAKRLEGKILLITKGAELKKLARENNDEIVILPDESIPARSGAGYMFSSLLTVLANSGIIDFEPEELVSLSETLKPDGFEKKGGEIAERIGLWTPLIYSSFQNRFLASFWKIKFNENSKIHAFWNHFPNAAHNEIAGFSHPERDLNPAKRGRDNFFVILLKDGQDGEAQSKKLLVAAELLDQYGIPYETIELKGRTKLEKIFNNFILSDWTSFYLAKNRGVSPTEAEVIEKFKEMEK